MKFRYFFPLIFIFSISSSFKQKSLDLSEFSKKQEQEEFNDRVLAKLRVLEDYFKMLSDKNIKDEKADEVIDAVLNLFIEDALVEVSSFNQSEVQQFKITEYCERLKLFKYSKVKIAWTNISYISDLKRNNDGNYYGTVDLEQKFEGYNAEGQKVFSDKIEKNITVVVKSFDKYVIKGREDTFWYIYFGDIGVEETK
ncbi:hypothetical protein [Flexithrix dorotheae]|uniref:hypothetical protein n=1 Tax=Flexithrix dorotheae TaxID=70993 RepID=UPI000372AB1F|nr:hypothetical protein [Flexithrix dorotheae]